MTDTATSPTPTPSASHPGSVRLAGAVKKIPSLFWFRFSERMRRLPSRFSDAALPSRRIHSIAVPTFRNHTLLPRIEALITGTVIKQFQQDGTFRIANEENADAVLKGEIVSVGRAPARSVRGNVLATTEFNLVLRVRYTLTGRNG